MKTITTNVYEFRELDENVQNEVIENEREDVARRIIDMYDEEFEGTLDEVEKAFQIKIKDWDYPYSCRFVFTSSRWEKCADDPKFLCRYLDEIWHDLVKGKYYSTPGRVENGEYLYKAKRSKVLFDFDWTLTGTWTDEEIMEAMRKRYEAVRDGETIREFVENMLYKFMRRWEDERRDAYDDDTVRSELEDCDLLFFEDGRIYE